MKSNILRFKNHLSIRKMVFMPYYGGLRPYSKRDIQSIGIKGRESFYPGKYLFIQITD
jgi:hypothetical protein